ncbi:hypothetical protein Glove_117g628 [Diversispora epigaea]|uniref:Uncharacterized protein n=1 Tax=Diversispora epigaea TaxID=1348612 RepID=A0A397J122_9GLOM|nr:hypothetical protein Glove_117g628 [Diversispora epigaea]
MDPAHVKVLETNKTLRDELNSEDTTIIAQESENQELRSQVSKLKKHLRIALEDIKKKESYISYLEQELINLEDEVNWLKFRIHEIYSYRNIMEDITDMAQRLPQSLTAEIIQNYEDIQRHLASNRLQEIAQNNQLIDQRITQLQNQYDTSQGILNLTQTAFTNEQQNNPLPNPNMAAIQEVMKIISTRLSTISDYVGQEPPDIYYNKLRNINESCRPLECVAFDAAQRANVIIGKMAGKFFPVPAQNPYNANANIVTEAEMLNWMQGRYREIIVGSTRAISAAQIQNPNAKIPNAEIPNPKL